MAENLNRDVYMYANFNESAAQGLVEKLIEIDKEDRKALDEKKEPEIKPIRLHISSYGGQVSYLQSILTAMDSVLAPVVTVVEGAAFSCGSLLSVSGDYRMMGQSAELLIHPPTGFAYGELSYMKDSTQSLEKVEKWCIDLYAKHSVISKSDLEEAFKTHKQWWIGADEALELGLIDEIIPEKSFTFDRKKKTFSRTIKGESLLVELT